MSAGWCQDTPKWTHFGGIYWCTIVHVLNGGISADILCVSISMWPSVRVKTRSIRGILDPLERVFNRIGLLTQSLYARARIGIVFRGR